MAEPWRRPFAAAALAVLATASCDGLTFAPKHVPTSLAIVPSDTLLVAGDRVRFRVQVLDQSGNPMKGPPSWAPPAWSGSSSGGGVQVSDDGWVEARGFADGEVSVKVARLATTTRLRVNPTEVRLSAPAFHLSQGVQTDDGDVPLVAGRDALLRVFVTGDRLSFYQPRVHALFFQGDRLVRNALMSPGSELLPSAVDESRMDRSYNALVPGNVLQPGTSMVVELDRDGTVPLASGSQVRLPARGRFALDVRTLRRLDLTVVPVMIASHSGQRVQEWTRGLNEDGDQVHLARATLPIGEMRATVREPYTTSVDLTTSAGWGRLLGELTFLHIRDGEPGYYYGAVAPPEGSTWDGLGYIGNFRISVGVPDGRTLAHELGHNLGLRHAPCGGAAGSDEAYPHQGGSIGVWGYDFRHDHLVNPSLFRDVMGYCQPTWISDYHFVRAMEYRIKTEGAGVPAGGPVARAPVQNASAPAQKSLLLWGSAGGGELRLDPAFWVDAAPRMPSAGFAPDVGAGRPYRLEGLGPAGEQSFSFRFDASPVEFGGGRFLFTVPYDPLRDGALDKVVLSGPEGFFVLERSAGAPAAMITDRATGRLRAILQDWNGALVRALARAERSGDVEIALSWGLP